MKLRSKILISHISLLFIGFLIAIVIANTVVTNRLMAQAHQDLNEQALSVVAAVRESRFDINEPRRVLAYFKSGNIGGLIPSDIFLLSANKTLLYASNETLAEDRVLTIISGDHPDYLRVIKTLESDERVIGHLILTTEIKHIEAYTRTLRRSLVLGMFIALAIGGVIASIMGRSIIRPIQSLKKDINAYKDDSDHLMTPITTGDEIQALFEAYEEMTFITNAHMEERKRFFQNASHELKTPLMSIQGYAEAIKDGVVEGEEIDHSLSIIINKSKQLKRTVEELVYLSKLANEDFTYTYEESDLNQLIQGVLEDQAFVASDKGIQIVQDLPDEPVILKLDWTKFESVIENLVSNGLRYANTILKIEVTNEVDRVVIRVMDDGKGLGKDEETKVFERFYKGEDGHSGIGLSIVEEIVRSHKGKIRAGNHISGGAVFEITINR